MAVGADRALRVRGRGRGDAGAVLRAASDVGGDRRGAADLNLRGRPRGLLAARAHRARRIEELHLGHRGLDLLDRHRVDVVGHIADGGDRALVHGSGGAGADGHDEPADAHGHVLRAVVGRRHRRRQRVIDRAGRAG